MVRTSQFVALTEAGELVRQYAERMLLEQEALKQELALFHGELSGTLRIGIVPQSNVDIMPLIARCKQRYPDIVIRLSVLSNEALLSQLELHQCDIGLGFDEPLTGAARQTFHLYPQGHNQMAVLMNRDEADQRLPGDETDPDSAAAAAAGTAQPHHAVSQVSGPRRRAGRHPA